MTKLEEILVEGMIGDMTKILVPKNANKTPEELKAMIMPKLQERRAEIKATLRDAYKKAWAEVHEDHDFYRPTVLDNAFEKAVDEL